MNVHDNKARNLLRKMLDLTRAAGRQWAELQRSDGREVLGSSAGASATARTPMSASARSVNARRVCGVDPLSWSEVRLLLDKGFKNDPEIRRFLRGRDPHGL